MPASRLSRFPLPLPRFPPLSHVSPTPTLSSIPSRMPDFLAMVGVRAGDAGKGELRVVKRRGVQGKIMRGSAGGAGAVEVCECSAGGGCNDGRYFNTVARAADEDLVALGVRRLAHMREYDEAEGGDVDSTFHEWVSAVKSALAAAKGGSGNGATLRASGGQEEDEEEEVEEEEEEEEGYEEYKGESEEEEGEGEGRAEGLVDLEDVAGPHAPARAHANALTRGTLWARALALAGTAREALRGGEMAVAEGVARGAGMGKSRGAGWFGKGACTRTMRG
ncbi:unnamed protein product [Closterium sp. Naga37s-1]|nr:unnamed protein product [Closterium sp. Naga37s-1]